MQVLQKVSKQGIASNGAFISEQHILHVKSKGMSELVNFLIFYKLRAI